MRELKAQRDEHTTAWTAAVSLVFGLNKSLEMIHAEGLCRRSIARHRLMAQATRAAAPRLGLKLIAPDNPAPGVTGILTPDGHRRIASWCATCAINSASRSRAGRIR